jgi:neurofibromin 1
MGLVVATCFQHNPSTQPQAFTVLGQLVSEEVDDDLVYQILVAMSTTLGHYSESDANLVISMLRCLSRIISGLLPDSRYAGSLFWLAVGVCQLGYIPVFSAALELMKASLRSMAHSGAFAPGLAEGMMDNRRNASDAARKLDTVCGVNFEASPHFSIVAIIFKGVRHPSTRRHAVETLTELLKLSASKPSTSYHHNTSAIANSNSNSNGEDTPMIPSQSLAYFVALLPVMAGSSAELKELFASAGLSVAEESLRDVAALSVFDLLNIP